MVFSKQKSEVILKERCWYKMGRNKKYSKELMDKAIDISRAEGCKKASETLGIPYKTIYNWYNKKNKHDGYNRKSVCGINALQYRSLQSCDKEADSKVKTRLVKFFKEELYFDINDYAGKDKDKRQEKRDFISFIQDIKSEYKEGNILQVLAKPHLENIYNEYSESCKNDKLYKIIYNRTFDKLQDNEYAMKSYEIYHKADYEFELILWKYRHGIIFNLNSHNSIDKLNEALCYIKENLLDGFFEGPFKLKENLIKSFYNLLICHQIICKETDKINMNNSLYYLDKPTDNYITSLSSNIKFIWSKSVALEELEKYIKGIPTDNGKCLWDYITYGNYNEADKKYYKYAFDKFEKCHMIYNESLTKEDNYKDDGWYNPYNEKHHKKNKAIIERYNVLENVSIIELIAIMQELIYMKKNKLMFNNKFYNNKNIPMEMTTKLKAGEKAEAAAKKYFIRCVQNRVAHDLGNGEEMKIWRTIENELYKLKIQLFSIYDTETFTFSMHSIKFLLNLLDLG